MTDDQPARAERDGEAEDAGGELMSKGGDNLQHRRLNAEHRLGGAREQQDEERGLRRLRAMAEQAETRSTARRENDGERKQTERAPGRERVRKNTDIALEYVREKK